MKYVLVLVMSLAWMINASAFELGSARRAVLEPVADAATPRRDTLLMAGVAAALVALELRRRHKSLRTPRI